MITITRIHGHEILHLLHEAPAPYTRAGLHAEAVRRFGPAARYHTCSAAGLTLDQLLAFLISRGKIVEQEGCLAADISHICSDNDAH